MVQKLRLRDLREDNFWKQSTVATLLKIKRRTYAEYELGNNMISIALLYKLARIYNVSLDYICGLTNYSKPYGEYIEYDEKRILDNIKYLRKEHNLTQKSLGLTLSYSQNTISEYEKGLRSIPLDFLINLAILYKISLDEIIGIKVKVPIIKA